ncbi:MAG TPA: DUF1254 domain-containing protein [Thermomicrobiales bacterium]|nr:DUF1254 domain-containing protein [Thermomicrobiales bacterium]
MAQKTPLFNTPIPSKIMTPDRVTTRLGVLESFDGMPTDDTAALLLEHLTFLRGVEVFLNTIPAASLEAMRCGLAELGVNAANQVAIFDDLMDSNSLFLTGNTDTVYALSILDLGRDGPTVVEIPAGCGPGTVDDAWFRFVVDMGAPGPDRGQGGKYLLLPPGYDGEVPDGYFTAESPSYVNLIALRGFIVDGSTEPAARMFRDGVKIYPLDLRDDPPPMEFVNGSGQTVNTIHANNIEFYDELARVIDHEPVEIIDPETRGLIASIGIQKGKSFQPDEQLRATLADAAAVGNATARSIFFQTTNPEEFLYEGSSWKRGFIGGNFEFLLDGTGGERNLDARTAVFYMATLNTPAMVAKMIGRGSQYAWGDRDHAGSYLDGAKTYRLHLPPDAPAKDFWSVVVYDPQTRSELQTGQPLPSKNNAQGSLTVNPDRSVDLYFGPHAPAGFETNWIQTVPGKGWFCLLRLYGPLESWFDKTWRPGEIELSE